MPAYVARFQKREMWVGLAGVACSLWFENKTPMVILGHLYMYYHFFVWFFIKNLLKTQPTHKIIQAKLSQER